MNTFSLIMSIIVWVIVAAAAIRGSRLERKLRQERRHLTTACGLLWALADRTEPKTLYAPKDQLKPAKGGPAAVTLKESDNGWTITASTHHQEDES